MIEMRWLELKESSPEHPAAILWPMNNGHVIRVLQFRESPKHTMTPDYENNIIYSTTKESEWTDVPIVEGE